MVRPEGVLVGVDFIEIERNGQISNERIVDFKEERSGKTVRIEFQVGDITNFERLNQILENGEKWASIVCCSAFVLLTDRCQVLNKWRELPKGNGNITLDVLETGTRLPVELHSNASK